ETHERSVRSAPPAPPTPSRSWCPATGCFAPTAAWVATSVGSTPRTPCSLWRRQYEAPLRRRPARSARPRVATGGVPRTRVAHLEATAVARGEVPRVGLRSGAAPWCQGSRTRDEREDRLPRLALAPLPVHP